MPSPRFAVPLLIVLSAGSLHAQTIPAADHHAHLQSATAARLLNQGAITPPGTPPNAAQEKPETAADLVAVLDAAGIRRSVALSDAYRLGSPFVRVPDEAAAVDAENDWTLDQAQQYPQRLVGFCSVNPTRAYAIAAIEHCAHIGLRGGLKLHLANADFRFEDSAQLRALRGAFAAANRLRMPILIHLRADRVWNAKRNVQIFLNEILPLAPDVPVQVAHLGGWGGYDRTTDAALSTFAKYCTRHPEGCRNLYFDLAAVILAPPDPTKAPDPDLQDLRDQQRDFANGPDKLAANLRRLGLSHILFATDWPEISPRDYIPLLRTQLRLSPAEIDQVFSNAAPYLP